MVKFNVRWGDLWAIHVWGIYLGCLEVIGMKLSDEGVWVMFHIGVQAKIIFYSCVFDGGDLEVIMKSNICDVPRGFSNLVEADALKC